jgi:uncharacterized protein
MPERLLDQTELEDIVWGATLLGAGGGGSSHDGLKLAKEIEKPVALVDPADLHENCNAVCVAGIGAPKALADKGFGPEALFAFDAVKTATAIGGVNIKCVMPGEIGGMNTMVPIYVAAKRNVPVLDADGNGRAVPELATGLYPIYGIPTSPLIIANKEGDIISAYLADPLDVGKAETIVRNAAISYGMLAAFATWVVNVGTVRRCLVCNSVSKAEAIGRAIRLAKVSGKDPSREIIEITEGREILRGTIKKIEVKSEEGFDFGTVTIEGLGADKERTIVIDVKNENIIAWEQGSPLIMVPDLIVMMTIDGTPLSNVDTREGMEVVVLGIPAPKPWTLVPEGFACWSHILQKLHYDGPFVGPFMLTR